MTRASLLKAYLNRTFTTLKSFDMILFHFFDKVSMTSSNGSTWTADITSSLFSPSGIVISARLAFLLAQ